MTSDDPRDRSRDELASALLDGVLPPGEAEAARRDPGVMDRAAALTAARDALRASPLAPADPAARERALTRALAEFDAEGAAGQARHGPRPDVVHLRSRRRGGAGGSAARWLGVAAAVLVLAGIAGIAVSREDDGDQAGTTASADLESAPEAAEAPATSGAGDRAADSQSEGGAAMAPAPVEVGDLGGFASPDDLVDAVGSLLPDARPAPDAAPATGADGSDDLATSSCAGDGAVPGLGDTAAATLHGRAVVDGDAVEVWVVATAAGDRVVAIDASCRVVVDRTLP